MTKLAPAKKTAATMGDDDNAMTSGDDVHYNCRRRRDGKQRKRRNDGAIVAVMSLLSLIMSTTMMTTETTTTRRRHVASAFSPSVASRLHRARYNAGDRSTSSDSSPFSPRSRRTTKLRASDDDDDDDDVCTIQILMSDTGGGHRASANALSDAFETLYPGGKIKCDIVDLYTDYGPVWPYNDYVAIYKLMARYPVTWDFFYHFGATDFGMCLNNLMLETFCYDSFRECLARPTPGVKGRSDRADMVVSVHPLCQDVPLKILSELDSNDGDDSSSPSSSMSARAGGRTTPFCTVVTDLGSAHPTWFHPDVDKCFVPSDALNKAAKKRGLQSSQIVQYGLAIRRGFWDDDAGGDNSIRDAKVSGDDDDDAADEKRGMMRAKLGIETDLPTVLVVGGGDGMGGIVDIARVLGRKLGAAGGGDDARRSQMVVVCGNNEEARNKLEKFSDWGSGVKVNVQGFVNNMDEWMRASDALVTKAGPGTIAEASICGLPCMMFSFLPGQEAGNIPFVEESGFGKYSGDPSVIADTVGSWLRNPEKLHSMQSAALKASRPHATLDIAKDLARIAFKAREDRKKRNRDKNKKRTDEKTQEQDAKQYFFATRQ